MVAFGTGRFEWKIVSTRKDGSHETFGEVEGHKTSRAAEYDAYTNVCSRMFLHTYSAGDRPAVTILRDGKPFKRLDRYGKFVRVKARARKHGDEPEPT